MGLYFLQHILSVQLGHFTDTQMNCSTTALVLIIFNWKFVWKNSYQFSYYNEVKICHPVCSLAPTVEHCWTVFPVIGHWIHIQWPTGLAVLKSVSDV